MSVGVGDKKTQQGGTPLCTPLCIASEMGHTDGVLLLTEKGANVNHAYNDGTTPLLIASQEGHTDVVKKLLSAGADVNRPGFQQQRPIFIASCVSATKRSS